MPTFEEIQIGVGYKSVCSVRNNLSALCGRRWLGRDYSSQYLKFYILDEEDVL